MPDHDAHDHHDHHHHGSAPLTLEQRHAHEAETYDRMAEEIRSTWTDPDYVVPTDRIPFANREHVDFLTDAIGRLGPLAGRRILEVGAGGGSLAVWLAHQGAEVVGIDVSPGILDVARRRAEASGVADRTTFVCRPIEHFVPADAGLGDLRFDGIIGNNVVHHFERDLALHRIGELLAPAASAVFCEPILLLPEWVRSVRNSSLVTRRFPMHTHSPDERSLGTEDFDIMRRHFDVVEWTPYQVLCRLQNFVELSDPAWHRLERWDRRILAHVPGARRVSRMAVITLSRPASGHRAPPEATTVSRPKEGSTP